MLQRNPKNIVLGAGYVYFDLFDEQGRPTGERYLAETPGFAISITSENLEDWSSDGPIAEKLLDVAIRVNRAGSMGLKDMSMENFALFVIGGAEMLSTSAATVSAAAVNGGQPVQQGLWYQLGVSDALPTGVRGIEDVAIKSTAETPVTFDIDDDYLLDAELGRIYIVPGGAIDDIVIVSDYDTTAVDWEQVTSDDLGAKRGALRFIAHNTSGKNRDLFLPDVVLRPDGEFAMKSRDTVQQMSFALGINLPGDGRAAVYVNGRPEA